MAEDTREAQTFTLDKVLTISAGEYCNLIDTGSICDYTAVGVHGRDMDAFLKNVPKDAEVVVNYRAAYAGINLNNNIQIHSGTALIYRFVRK